MKTFCTIVTRWVIEVFIVVGIAIAFFIIRCCLGYEQGDGDELINKMKDWAPQFFLYLTLTLTTAIPWGLYWRAYLNWQKTENLNGGEPEKMEMFCVFCFCLVLVIYAVNYFWATPDTRHITELVDGKTQWRSEGGSFKEWAPYLASLAPLALWLLDQFIKICQFLNPKETAKTAPLPTVGYWSAVEMDKIADCVEEVVRKNLKPFWKDLNRTKKALRKIEKKMKGNQKQDG